MQLHNIPILGTIENQIAGNIFPCSLMTIRDQ